MLLIWPKQWWEFEPNTCAWKKLMYKSVWMTYQVRFQQEKDGLPKCLIEVSSIEVLPPEAKMKLRTWGRDEKHPGINSSRKPAASWVEATKRRHGVDESSARARSVAEGQLTWALGTEEGSHYQNTKYHHLDQSFLLACISFKCLPLAESNIKPDNKENHKGSTPSAQNIAEGWECTRAWGWERG